MRNFLNRGFKNNLMTIYKIDTKGRVKRDYARSLFNILADAYDLSGDRSSVFVGNSARGLSQGSFYLIGDEDLKVRFQMGVRGLEVITDYLTEEQVRAVL